ncbi:MAG: LEA type 2 family protein [Pseudomonadota bacterium]
MKNNVFKTRRSVLWLVALTTLFLNGCSTLLASVEAPKLSLTNVQMLSSSLLEQRYRLTLRVANPNPVTLPISGMSYSVKFAGVDFASGVTPNAFRIPARGEHLVDIDVSTNLLRTAQQLMSVMRGNPDSLSYELTGSVDVDLPLVGSVPFSQSGEVALRSP